MNVGLLFLRLVVGALFLGHGSRKLFGWFDGPGIHDTGERFDQHGYRPGIAFATGVGLAEAVAGVLFVVGVFTPLAAALLVAVMVVAIGTVHAPRGIWNDDGGYEFHALVIAAAGTLAFTGPGSLSIGDGTSGAGWGFAALLAGVALGLVTLAFRRPAAAPVDDDQPELDLTLRMEEDPEPERAPTRDSTDIENERAEETWVDEERRA
ncbi:MAG TPA: DoxX family protein [Acidimicrobiia bacterium]|nr:DoxX family protein [Acidimicrobiia bacterium]